mmetsp:Transcript_7612/g.20795  ORF Transcript_7612/g.20795 Transcript_7612/m.20795 type:complete len:232 (-) Transcript_7612:185-880(-)
MRREQFADLLLERRHLVADGRLGLGSCCSPLVRAACGCSVGRKATRSWGLPPSTECVLTASLGNMNVESLEHVERELIRVQQRAHVESREVLGVVEGAQLPDDAHVHTFLELLLPLCECIALVSVLPNLDVDPARAVIHLIGVAHGLLLLALDHAHQRHLGAFPAVDEGALLRAARGRGEHLVHSHGHDTLIVATTTTPATAAATATAATATRSATKAAATTSAVESATAA